MGLINSKLFSSLSNFNNFSARGSGFSEFSNLISSVSDVIYQNSILIIHNSRVIYFLSNKVHEIIFQMTPESSKSQIILKIHIPRVKMWVRRRYFQLAYVKTYYSIKKHSWHTQKPKSIHIRRTIKIHTCPL